MDSECPVIEDVDNNSNKGETIDTQAINDNEQVTANDNESPKQTNEEKKNLVNQKQVEVVKEESLESCESGASGEKTDTETDARSDNYEKVEYLVSLSHLSSKFIVLVVTLIFRILN